MANSNGERLRKEWNEKDELIRPLLKRGKKIYKRCLSCHKLEPDKHGTGPSLAGVSKEEDRRALIDYLLDK